MNRLFHVVAIPIRIVYNNFGDHDPNGRIYVLKENEKKVQDLVRKHPFSTVELIQPLTLRANEGDTVEILFENQLDTPASMHLQEASYDVLASDGAHVGLNPDTTVPPGSSIRYRLHLDHEGIYYFSDLGNPLSSETGTNVHGLFGALLVQRRGSWWTDPVTGGPLASGVYADVHHPFLPSFREYAWYFNDEPEQRDLTGNDPIDVMTLQPAESVHAVNYRAEPLSNRRRLLEEGVVCPDCDGEEVHHDSWVFGDPATPILRGYRGDPAKIRMIHGGVKETHVFHYHVHQWLQDPNDIDSEIVDAQSVSPQNHYTVEPLYGLGSLQGAYGDVIIHCHLYPHFEAGMWALNRIFDTLQDGSQCYPNGTPILPLQPLPDRPLPPAPTSERPGFPNFIPGKVGFKAPRPPLGIVGGREMTERERLAAVPNARPGAVFTDSCLGNPVVTEFNVSLIQMPIIYNKEGWHDPEGRLYVLDEDLEDVCSGRKMPEPLVIHAEAGTCIRINFTNRLPSVIGGNAYQLVTRTYESAVHVHFVKFDPLCSDGANVGWNYDSSVLPGQTIRYEWYADVELKATFFHDHLFAVAQQNHGVFGGIVIHPRFSRFLSSVTGAELELSRGTQITVTNPLIADYRDQTLFIHDWALLFDKNGSPIAPPAYPGSMDDPGVFGVNYRNEPLFFRVGPDKETAYSFSSTVHGDPLTPILRAYAGDPLRIRLFQGAHEESHSFNVHGLKWKRERRDIDSVTESQHHIGVSESFTFETFLPRPGDYLWAFEDVEDIWLGCWGLIRGYDHEVPDLIPLPDRALPPLPDEPLPAATGRVPPPATVRTPDSAPPGAPVRRFHVVAFQTPILYNKYGDHDPHGLIFALAGDVDDILCGKRNPEPLVLRANQGDLVEIRLTSLLAPEDFHNRAVHGYPAVKVPAFYPPSLRISLHPQLIDYDVRSSSGDTVGFNPDQTVGPGETITYRWYVDAPYGACNLWDVADLRNHRHHGAFGAFIAEPRGSIHLDPCTLEPLMSGAKAVILNPLLPAFREFVLMMHDGVRLLDKQGGLILDPQPIFGDEAEEPDTYDQGSRGFNYRTERLRNRLAEHPALSDAFSSHVFGDPATPLLEAYAGEPATVRLLTPSERRRSHTFHLHGHAWRTDALDVHAPPKSVRGQNIAGSAFDLSLIGGAGGLRELPGDYMYRSGNIRWDIELGMWGILRVHGAPCGHLPPLPRWKN